MVMAVVTGKANVTAFFDNMKSQSMKLAAYATTPSSPAPTVAIVKIFGAPRRNGIEYRKSINPDADTNA
jgi:hypothetical protein